MSKTSLILSLTIAAIALAISIDPSYADVFSTVQSKAGNAFTNIRNIIFTIGGFGIIGLGVMAYFGKWNWKWAFSLAAGMVVVAIASSAITYLTATSTDSASATSSPKWTDTLN